MNIKTAIRSLNRNRLNSLIIISSLAIGMACINLIAFFIKYELKTDAFHADSKRIYSLQCDDPWRENGKMHHCRQGSAEYMLNNFAQVESFCRINNATPKKVIVNKETYFDNSVVIAASDNFFSFFSYRLLTNNKATVLVSKNSLAISEELAKKYFGTNDPVGRVITLVTRKSEDNMVVSGVFKKPANNTQINFDMVRPMDDGDSRCYLKLKPGINPAEVEELFKANKESIPIIHDGTPGQYYLSSLGETYFDNSRGAIMEASREKSDLWVALAIGLLILVIGVFNYLGLLNNMLVEKQQNYAIRKINGGTKFHIIRSLMTESGILIIVSFVASIFLMVLAAPFFGKLVDAQISNEIILQSRQIISYFAIPLVIVGISLVFFLFRIRLKIDVNILKNKSSKSNKQLQIPAINIFQLAGTIVLIVGSIAILKQMHFITNKTIGLDKDVVEVKIPESYAKLTPVFKAELLKNPAVQSVAVTDASPLLSHFLLLLHYDDNGTEKEYYPAGFGGDENFLATVGARLIEGENFSDNPAVNKKKVIVNQSLAKLFPDRNLIGTGLPGREENIVIGIVEDFHYSNLKSVVEPAFIGYTNTASHLMVKASDLQQSQVNETIAATWDKLIPDYPLSVETIGERYEWMHRENQNFIRLIGACSAISIFLSMIGLFAISFQTSKNRTKEIGIRKVNGAKIAEILALLNKDFVKWVMIAFVIAIPVSWFAMNKWLENFAYKTSLSWWIFVLAGLLALGIALLTVSWQSWRAATRNPVEALRYE